MLPKPSIQKTILDNKLRVVTETVPHLDSVSIGIWVKAGARYEMTGEQGVSHFLEHMLFKGTKTRSARQIADEMDMVGGHLNAYTEKETTFYYAKVLGEHLETALDILSDMILNSVLDPIELEREKNVIIEEIKRREDAPDELVHDVFEQTIWKGHPLGNPIIGEENTVSSFTRDQLVDFMERCYSPNAIVIAAAGSVEHGAVLDFASRTFGELKGRSDGYSYIEAIPVYERRIVSKPIEQVHICLGTHGYPHEDKKKYTLAVIDAIVGGGMSSRLFQEIRENRGLAYAIGSYSASYREGGIFAVYAGASTENSDQVIDLILKEMENIRKNNVTDRELQRAKNQIRGALLMGQESTTNRMSRLASSEMHFERIIPLEEILDEITKITKDDVAEVAEELFQPSSFALAAVGPFENELDI